MPFCVCKRAQWHVKGRFDWISFGCCYLAQFETRPGHGSQRSQRKVSIFSHSKRIATHFGFVSGWLLEQVRSVMTIQYAAYNG